jgi:hypothetical protein
MSHIPEFVMGKGITQKIGEDFHRRYLEVKVKMPDKCTELDFQAALDSAEYVLDGWLKLETPKTAQIPGFDPEELMKHEGWKTKKKADGSYEEVSLATLSWAWDFIKDREGKPKFSAEIIAVLKKGPVTIDKYTFSLNEARGLINVKKNKDSAKK